MNLEYYEIQDLLKKFRNRNEGSNNSGYIYTHAQVLDFIKFILFIEDKLSNDATGKKRHNVKEYELVQSNLYDIFLGWKEDKYIYIKKLRFLTHEEIDNIDKTENFICYNYCADGKHKRMWSKTIKDMNSIDYGIVVPEDIEIECDKETLIKLLKHKKVKYIVTNDKKIEIDNNYFIREKDIYIEENIYIDEENPKTNKIIVFKYKNENVILKKFKIGGKNV